MRPLELKQVAADSQHSRGVALRQQAQQGNAAVGLDWPADHGCYAVALQVTNQQVGGGGQVRQGGSPFGRCALPQPPTNRLASDAEQLRRLCLAKPPNRQNLRKGFTRPSPTKAFGKYVKPSSLMPVRRVNLRRGFFRAKPVQQCFTSQQDSLLCFLATIRQPPFNVNPVRRRRHVNAK